MSPSQLGFFAIIPGLGSRFRRRPNKTIMAVVDIQQTQCTTSSFDSASNTVYNFYLHLLKVKRRASKTNPPQLFPPVMDYCTYAVQLNQKETKERVNYRMPVFQIPQILEIMTLFKNCRKFRDKYFASHHQESSLSGNVPSLRRGRSCTEQSRAVPVGTFRSRTEWAEPIIWCFAVKEIRQQRFGPSLQK